MTTAQDILKEAARIVRSELPKHLSADFAINDVEAESRPAGTRTTSTSGSFLKTTILPWTPAS